MRELNPLLTHYILVADGHWSKGATLLDASKAFRTTRGRPFLDCDGGAVWRVTAGTTIDETGRFMVPREGWAQPADVTED